MMNQNRREVIDLLRDNQTLVNIQPIIIYLWRVFKRIHPSVIIDSRLDNRKAVEFMYSTHFEK